MKCQLCKDQPAKHSLLGPKQTDTVMVCSKCIELVDTNGTGFHPNRSS